MDMPTIDTVREAAVSDRPGPALRIIEPSTGWRSIDFRELYVYRELLWLLTSRDVKVRYKQTVFGFAWAIVQPVMMMLVFSIFFGRLAKMPSDGTPYPIFVYAGLLPWTFFAGAINASSNSVLGSAQLVSKVYFPRIFIPLSAILGSLVDFVIATAVLLLMMAYYDIGWGVNLAMVPFLMCGILVTALGVGSLLSALTVAYRDFRFVVPFLVQFWMFATPVVYPASLVPETWRWLLYLNPMTGVVEGFRAAYLGHSLDVLGLSGSLIAAMVLLVIGVAYFERVERRFADVI